MNSAYYDNLNDLVKSNNIKIISIIAPARSSSTALERAISHSEQVGLQINDPWSIYDDIDREEKTYEYIVKKLTNSIAMVRNRYILIKDVADYIPPLEAYTRWEALTSKIIFLIRNPLLTSESMMKIMAKSLSADYMLKSGMNLQRYSQLKGYSDWLDMQEKIAESTNYYEFEEIFLQLFPTEKLIHNYDVLRLPLLRYPPKGIDKRLGFKSLNEYAVKLGLKNWSQVVRGYESNNIDKSILNPFFEEIFLNRITGWEALYQHFMRTNRNKKLVVDSSAYRADPENTMSNILKETDLKYVDSIKDWTKTKKMFDTDYDNKVPYYDKVSKSIAIQPPTEKPTTLDKLPGFVVKNLLAPYGPLEIYIRLLQTFVQENKVKAQHFENILVESSSLLEIDPVFIYCLYYVSKERDKKEKCNKIYNRYTNYKDVFNFVASLKL